MKADSFVSLFNSIKTVEKNRKGVYRGLSEKDTKNLCKLVKRGFLEEDFRSAITEMFRSPDQWAVSKNRDTTTHLLVNENFESYLNAAMNRGGVGVGVKEKPEEVKKQQKIIREEMTDQAEMAEARKMYSNSLEVGEWVGSIFNAKVLAPIFFKMLLPDTEKSLRKEARLIWLTEERKKLKMNLMDRVGVMFRNEENIYRELVVKAAIKAKRKI